ncbi:MAG TPA: ABC transporter ATP-binding protein [Polyangia bacterium]|jgi:ATP-binding cassette subfamily B protein
MRPEAARIAAGCLCLLATNGFALAIPWLLKDAIDALRHAGTAGPVTGVYGLVTRDALWIAGLAVTQAVIRTYSRMLIFNAGRNIEYTLRRDLFAHLLRMDAAFYRQHATGDVMSRLTNDLGTVRLLFGPGLLNLVNTAIVYSTGLFLLIRLSPSLTLIALIPYPALVLGGRAFSRAMYRASRDIQDQLGRMSTALQEDLAGITVVKSYALEPERHAIFSRLNDMYLQKSLRLVRARGILTPFFAVIAALGTLIVLWAGGREVIAGRITIGGLTAFNAYLAYLSWPTVALGFVLSIWQRGMAGWNRVRELLRTTCEIRDSEAMAAGNGDAGEALSPSIEARGLCVTRGERTVLDNVSFTLPAGGTLAIVGPTGSGKTTLVDTIPRLQEVAPGTLFIGGHDIRDIPLSRLRGMVGYAPQEAFLFSATVAENIGFAHPDAAGSDPAVRAAADAAGLGPDLAVLPDGYDTMVGERGITLSGGQRQRVALARALAAQPRILILDDSLSSVDASTEKEILTRLRPILKGRTSILISHRVAAVKDADQILVLDAGRVAERGTHRELLSGGGLYAQLYREQLAAEALAEAAL